MPHMILNEYYIRMEYQLYKNFKSHLILTKDLIIDFRGLKTLDLEVENALRDL